MRSRDSRNSRARTHEPNLVDLAVSLAVVSLGVLVLLGTNAIGLGSGYDRIGPRFFPYVVAAGLLLSGGLMLPSAWSSQEASIASKGSETSWLALAISTGALGASVLLLERAGFILSSTLLFWLVARAFGSKRSWRDALVGLGLSITIYVAFTQGLGLVLPRGFLFAGV